MKATLEAVVQRADHWAGALIDAIDDAESIWDDLCCDETYHHQDPVT